MRKTHLGLLTLCLLTMFCSTLFAQPERRQRRGDGARPPHPLLEVLDRDKDGELSFAEIERLVEVLKKVDKNGDKKLTLDELPRPQMAGRPGRPGPATDARPGTAEQDGFLARIRGMDANGDGKISKDEAPERMKENFDRLDTNSDGSLDKEEIARLGQRFREGRGAPERGAPPQRGDRGNMVERALNLDTDGDGKLSKDEAPEGMRANFDRIDSDGNGVLDKEELQKAAERLRGRRPDSD